MYSSHSEDLQEGPPEAHHSRRRVALVRSLSVLLVLTCIALVGGLYYVNDSAQKWQEKATATEAARAATQRQLNRSEATADQLRADLTKAEDALASVTDQYNEASARIRSLANEKAQVGDSLAQVQQLTALSRQVSTRLDACINDLRTLQRYIVNLDQYEVYDVIAYARNVNDSCDEAQGLNASLASMIDQL
jgi:septal ring factor EnvC (AmiA/AmiB activator)